jgi:SHS2 domain-containing protein
MYEVFDHTADLGLRIRAASKEELFADAGQALYSVIVENLSEVRPLEEQTIQISGQDTDYLLFDWLTELLFLFETRRLLLSQFDIRLDSEGLKGVCRGEPFDPGRHRLEHEVKAITYHGLKVVSDQKGWLAEVIVDI